MIFLCRESASPSTSDRPVARWATPAGSCTAWSTASPPMVPCPPTKLLEALMIPSTPSSARLVPATTFQGLYLWISSLPLLVSSDDQNVVSLPGSKIWGYRVFFPDQVPPFFSILGILNVPKKLGAIPER